MPTSCDENYIYYCRCIESLYKNEKYFTKIDLCMNFLNAAMKSNDITAENIGIQFDVENLAWHKDKAFVNVAYNATIDYCRSFKYLLQKYVEDIYVIPVISFKEKLNSLANI